MENKNKQSGVLRRRGRPAGKNRVPLSLEERRARNAQYERERRAGMADALAELADAAGCHSSIASTELLATVITQLQRASQFGDSDDVDTLRRQNKNLMSQIEMLEQRLDDSGDGCSSARTRGEVDKKPRPIKRKREYHELPVSSACDQPKREASYSSFACNGTPAPAAEYQMGAAFENLDCRYPVQQVYQQPTPHCHFDVYAQYRYPVPEQLHILPPGLCRSGPSTPEDKQQFVEEVNHTVEPEDLHGQEFPPTDPWLSHAAMPALCLSNLKMSPVHRTSEHQERFIDYSAYHFAGPQIPTPEYHIGSSEYIQPAQPCADQGFNQPPLQYHSGPSSPDEQFSPTQFLNPVVSYGSLAQHCDYEPVSSEDDFTPHHCSPGANFVQSSIQESSIYRSPVQPDVVRSVEIIPVPESFSLPVVNGAVQDHWHFIQQR